MKISSACTPSPAVILQFDSDRMQTAPNFQGTIESIKKSV